MEPGFSSSPAGVNPDQPAPGQSRYGWLAATLRARITQGEWVPGTALPAEAALAREHGVALGTLRQALALLVAEGLLERHHGRGTFVRAGLGGASMLRFFRFRHGGDLTATPSSSILSRQRGWRPGRRRPRPWACPTGASVLELQRLRSIAGEPCLLEQLWLPLPAFDALKDSDTATWGDLLYPLYQRLCGVTVNKAEDDLRFGLLNQRTGGAAAPGRRASLRAGAAPRV
jgi:GntR family transcriptional regulator